MDRKLLLNVSLAGCAAFASLATAETKGELLATDRVNAWRALKTSVGELDERDFTFSVGGCGFSTCTSVVARYAVFVKELPRAEQKVR